MLVEKAISKEEAFSYSITTLSCFQKSVKDHSSLAGSIITITEEIVQNRKISVQTIMYNGKLNEDHLPASVDLYANLKTNLSVPLLPDSYSLAQELICVYLMCYIRLNALKITFNFIED